MRKQNNAAALVLLLAVGPVSAAGPVVGAAPTSNPAVCAKRLPAYEPGWLQPRGLDRLALRSGGGGELLYLAAEHSNDPWHSQLARFEREMRLFRPTVVLFEGEAQAVGKDRPDTVRRYGETGFLRFLATQLQIPARSLDPGASEQIRFVASRFDPQEVKIYYVLREIWLLRDRRGRPDKEIRQLALDIIAGRLLSELPRVLLTEKEFEREFAARWPPGRNWLAPKAAWFDPYRTAKRSGGVFTNDLERASVMFRDLFMYRSITEAVLSGERVFAIAGGGHLPVQAPALRCALGR